MVRKSGYRFSEKTMLKREKHDGSDSTKLDRTRVMRRFAQHPYAVIVMLAAIVLLLPLLVSSTFHLRIAALVFIFALAVVGLNLLMGFAGQVSLGHAGFFGIGAYAVAIGPTHLGIPSWAALIAGAAIAGALAYLVRR